MKSRRILCVIQDASFTYDNRVRREAKALQEIGYQVQVVCPRWQDDPSYKLDNGVHTYFYPSAEFSEGTFGYLAEYIYAVLMISWTVLRVRLKHGFDAIHVCNPPDFLIPILSPYKLLGTKIVYDQHDLVPEVYVSKFGDDQQGFLFKVMLFLEKFSSRTADHVMFTNQWHKKIQSARTGLPDNKGTIVRNGPTLDKFAGITPNPNLKRGYKYIIAYLGNMNDHDGVDYLLHSIHYLHHELGMTDLGGVCIGSGPAFDNLLALRHELGLDEVVQFTGRLPFADVLEYLVTIDIGACPDPKNPLSDISTMNKTMDYMAAGKPLVAFDLKETRSTAEDAGIYATPNDVQDYALKIKHLLDNPDLRQQMGKIGRQRIENGLAWEHNKPYFIRVYQSLWSS